MYWGTHTSKVRCRYYIRESEKEITCMGLEPETLYSTKFNSKEEKTLFQEKHCLPGCNRCSIFKILENSP